MRTIEARVIALTLFAVAGVASSPFAHATQYQIVNLGGEFAANFLYDPQINDVGQVLMETATGTQLWSNGTYTQVNGLGGPTMKPFGLNNLGQVAGESQNTGNVQPIFGQNGQTIYLNPPAEIPAGQNVGAGRINDSGQLILNWGTYSAAYVWQSGTYSRLPDLFPAALLNSRAHGINNDGILVGGSIDSNGNGWPVIWHDGVVEQLALPPAPGPPIDGGISILLGISGTALDISDSGQIVGVGDYLDGTHAVVWTDIGSPGNHNWVGNDIGVLPIGPATLRINDAGIAVGYGVAQIAGIGFAYSPYVIQDGEFRNVNSLLPVSSGWTLNTASDINDSGQIVGLGIDPGGHSAAYLLTPIPVPEPSSLALLAAGGAFLAAAWRCRQRRSSR